MTAILYFLLFAGLFFFMMRMGCGAHVTGHGGHGEHDRDRGDRGETAPEKAVDPVCGMTVETATAKSSVFDGQIYYFCSQNCRDKFEGAPQTYIKGMAAQKMPMEAHHGTH